MIFNNLWGIPIYKQNVNYAFSQFDEDTKEYIENYITQTDTASKNVNVFMERGYFLEDLRLIKIKDLIQQQALSFRDNIMKCSNELLIQSSWFTINHKDSNHGEHKHPHTIFSVCYYPRAESGNLVFCCPDGKNTWQKDYRFGFNWTEWNEWNSSDWTIPVQSGDVVIFPGWVQHFTTPNESDKPRLMIGANYWLKGEMQFKDELDRINV